MPDTTTTPAVFKFDEKAFNDKLTKLAAARDAVAGKDNYNPFLWWNENVQPAIESVKAGKPNATLVSKVLNLSEVVPPINPKLVVSKEETKK